MSVPGSFLSPQPSQSGWSTPATSLTISPPTTPNPALPEEILAASPVDTAGASRRLSQFEFSNEGSGEAPLHNVSSKGRPRISRPVPMMRTEYDVIVIGSGYGGGVAASRMARAGKKVCLLEFGEERWPGEYPVGTMETVKELITTGNSANAGEPFKEPMNLPGAKKNSLYRLILGDGQNVFVGCGLGGTSLLNANVFLPADEKTLQMDAWPGEIRRDPDHLHKYYERAASVLEPVQYPDDAPKLAKLTLLEEQAKRMGWHKNFRKVQQTTTFHDRINSTGVEQKASRLTGQDSTGINDGSKNSTLVNYVADAWNWGTEIFCECEVRYVKKAPSGEGYIVYFAWHGDKRDCHKDDFYNDLMWVRAKDFVFLGAGAMGTTEILLRSRDHGLETSPMVGKNMSGNGDILGFGYNTKFRANALGKENPAEGDEPVGPTITGIIDMRDTEDPLDGFVVEEGTIPEALQVVMPFMLKMSSDTSGTLDGGILNTLSSFGSLAARTGAHFIGKPIDNDPLKRTQVYLIMSHDSNEAMLTLEDDRPHMQFFGVGRQEHVLRLNETLSKLTASVGGTYIDSPFQSDLFGQEQISVHPIGGAVMSYDGTGTNGVTNHMGQVFVGEGKEVYEGLFCVDASVIPCALGANPFATITALAERSVELACHQNGLRINWARNGKLDLFGRPRVTHPLTDDMKRSQREIQAARSHSDAGGRFTEIMEGHIYLGDDIKDFQVAENVAKGAASSAKFYLSIDAWSTRTLVDSKDHASMLTGTFSHGALSQDPFMVLRGVFKLFSQDVNTPETKNLAYEFDMVGTDGQKIHFYGYKVIDSSMAFSVSGTWKATTTLNVTLTSETGAVIGRGRLHVTWRNFLNQLKTFGGIAGGPQSPVQTPPVGGLGIQTAETKPTTSKKSATPSRLAGPSMAVQTLAGTALKRTRGPREFLTFFTKETVGFFFKPLASFVRPSINATGYFPKLGATDSFPITASDGVSTELKKWAPLDIHGPPKTPILFIPGAAVDTQIYALPTIDVNAVEYFVEKGHTVYVMNSRVGRTELSKDPRNFTTYDARLDVAAALKYISETHKSKLYIIAHCAGSLALASGLLDGTIPTVPIQGLTASQVFMHPIFTRLNFHKAQLPASLAWKALTNTTYFNTTPVADDKLTQKAMDQILRFYPVGGRTELCSSRTCHRSSLVFGRLWRHKSLNEATHVHLPNFLGGINMTCLTHLMHSGTRGEALDNEGNSLVTPENIARLKSLNVLFLHGEENAVYMPESTGKSFNVFQTEFGARKETQAEVFKDCGHLDTWMGTGSKEVTFPRVLAHVREVEDM